MRRPSRGRWLAPAPHDVQTVPPCRTLRPWFSFPLEHRNARVPADRRVELDERLLAWQRQPELKDTAVKILAVFQNARLTRAADMTYIESQVQRLGNGRRGET